MIDIGSEDSFPVGTLSNFSAHAFTIDGIRCNSMEGFLQSLKFKDLDEQEYVCSLIGVQAKYRGKKKKWWKEQILYWRGVEIARDSQEYQDLLDRAFNKLAKNEDFLNALIATGDAKLMHSMGNKDIQYTVLTEKEFCDRLTNIRNKY